MTRAIAAASGAAGRWRLDYFMMILAAMLLTYVWRVQDIVPGLNKLRLGLVLGVVVVGALAADRLAVRRLTLVAQNPLARLMIAFAIIAALTVPTSLWPGKSANQLMITVMPNVVLGLAVAAGLRTLRDADFLLRVLLAGGLFFCLVGLTNSIVGERLAGAAFYDPNDLALIIVAVIPIAIYLMRPMATRQERYLGLVSLGIFVLVLARSGSRGGFLGFSAVMIYVLLRFVVFPKLTRLKAVAAGVVLLLLFAGPAYWTTMRTMFDEDDYNRNSPTGRVEVWKRGLGYMSSRPLLGVGLSAYPQAEGRSESALARAERDRGFKWSVAHNSFLEVGVEQGVPGFIVFFGFFVGGTLILRRLIRRHPEINGRWSMAPMAQVLIASLLGFAVSGFFLSAQHFSVLYMLLGLTVGLAKLDRVLPVASDATRVHAASAPPAPMRTPEWRAWRTPVSARLVRRR